MVYFFSVVCIKTNCTETLQRVADASWVFSNMAANFPTLPIIQDGDHAKIPHPEDVMSDQNPYPRDIRDSQIPVGARSPPHLGLDTDRRIKLGNFVHSFEV